ncbi:MAG: PPC domain-containing DNA-binding protein [Bdellovibrionota bacterium]
MFIKKINDSKYMMRLEKDEMVMESIKKFAKKYNVKSAEVRALGAIDYVSLSLYRPATKDYDTREFNEPFEISCLYGNISSLNGEPYSHIHISLNNTNYEGIGGHLNEARISATLEAYIDVFDVVVDRKKDENVNLNVWDI